MATDFQASQWIPANATDLQRGGGPACIYIETTSDYSARQTSAKWDLLAMFSKKDYDISSSGGGEKPLDVEFIDGEKYTIDDSSTSTVVLAKKLVFTTYRENLMEFIDSVKGKRYFIVDLVSRVGTTKRVFFGFGYFSTTLKRSSSFGSVVSYDIEFIVKAHGCSGTPTFPVLPLNTDDIFTTDAQNMKYVGWLLASADSTKGGYGNIVALPTTGELHSTKCGIVKSI